MQLSCGGVDQPLSAEEWPAALSSFETNLHTQHVLMLFIESSVQITFESL